MFVRMDTEAGEGLLDLGGKVEPFRRKGCGRSRRPASGLGDMIPVMDEFERMIGPNTFALVDVGSELTIARTR